MHTDFDATRSLQYALKGDYSSALLLVKTIINSIEPSGILSYLGESIQKYIPGNSKYVPLFALWHKCHASQDYAAGIREFQTKMLTINDPAMARILLISLRCLSKEICHLEILQLFEKSIEDAQMGGKCTLENTLLNDYCDYVVKNISDSDIIRKTLFIQLDLLDELNLGKELSLHSSSERYSKIQLDRYISLIMKYFDISTELTEENLLKKVDENLSMMICDLKIDQQIRYQAMFHLSSLTMRFDLLCLYNIAKSHQLLNELSNMDIKDVLFQAHIQYRLAESILETINLLPEIDHNKDWEKYRKLLLQILYNKNFVNNQLKAKCQFVYAQSYLNWGEKQQPNYSCAKGALTQSIALANPSSFLIPLAKHQLGCMLILGNSNVERDLSLGHTYLIESNKSDLLGNCLRNQNAMLLNMIEINNSTIYQPKDIEFIFHNWKNPNNQFFLLNPNPHPATVNKKILLNDIKLIELRNILYLSFNIITRNNSREILEFKNQYKPYFLENKHYDPIIFSRLPGIVRMLDATIFGENVHGLISNEENLYKIVFINLFHRFLNRIYHADESIGDLSVTREIYQSALTKIYILMNLRVVSMQKNYDEKCITKNFMLDNGTIYQESGKFHIIFALEEERLNKVCNSLMDNENSYWMTGIEDILIYDLNKRLNKVKENNGYVLNGYKISDQRLTKDLKISKTSFMLQFLNRYLNLINNLKNSSTRTLFQRLQIHLRSKALEQLSDLVLKKEKNFLDCIKNYDDLTHAIEMTKIVIHTFENIETFIQWTQLFYHEMDFMSIVNKLYHCLSLMLKNKQKIKIQLSLARFNKFHFIQTNSYSMDKEKIPSLMYSITFYICVFMNMGTMKEKLTILEEMFEFIPKNFDEFKKICDEFIKSSHNLLEAIPIFFIPLSIQYFRYRGDDEIADRILDMIEDESPKQKNITNFLLKHPYQFDAVTFLELQMREKKLVFKLSTDAEVQEKILENISLDIKPWVPKKIFIQIPKNIKNQLSKGTIPCKDSEPTKIASNNNRKFKSDKSKPVSHENNPLDRFKPDVPSINSFQNSTDSSYTKEVKESAKAQLANEDRKRTKKESRVPSVPLENKVEAMATKSSDEISIDTQPIMRKKLTPTAMKIFEKFWIPQNPQNDSYQMYDDEHDFRDDVKISRDEAEALIIALGGTYQRHQGKGSHKKAILAHIEGTDQIILNGQKMIFANFEMCETSQNKEAIASTSKARSKPESQTMTFTKDQNLKFYQIRQLCRKLMLLGYTPLTVELEH